MQFNVIPPEMMAGRVDMSTVDLDLALGCLKTVFELQGFDLRIPPTMPHEVIPSFIISAQNEIVRSHCRKWKP